MIGRIKALFSGRRQIPYAALKAVCCSKTFKVLGTVAVVSYYLAFHIERVNSNKAKPIDKMIERGTKPEFEELGIDRSSIVDNIIQTCKDSIRPQDNKAGVILGPKGSGKSYLTRSACNKHPEGFLYCDASSSTEFSQLLAETIGIPTKPTGLYDLIMRCFGSKNTYYYNIPEDNVAAVGFMLDILNQRAIEFQMKRREKFSQPCLFIDGADKIAECQPEVFAKLVDVAKKRYEPRIGIIFVSNGGPTLHYLDHKSLEPRLRKIEIPDISDQEAMTYLISDGMSENLAKEVVDLVGGRFEQLNYALSVLRKENVKSLSQEKQLETITDHLCWRYVDKALSCTFLVSNGRKVLYQVVKDGSVNVDALLLEEPTKEERAATSNAIQTLCQDNILYYDINGNICLSSKILNKYKNDF